jgi:hypothetical protein
VTKVRIHDLLMGMKDTHHINIPFVLRYVKVLVAMSSVSMVSIVYVAIFVSSIIIIRPCYGGIVPELYLGVASPMDGGFATATLEPSLKVSTKGSLFNDFCDYSGGATIQTDENGQLPFKLWGTIQKSVFGWDCKARLDTESSNLENVDYNVQAMGGPTSLLVKATGYVRYDKSKVVTGHVQNVALTQGFRLPVVGGTLSVSPAYNLASKRSKVSMAYDVTASTQIIIDANQDQQKATVVHTIGKPKFLIRRSLTVE